MIADYVASLGLNTKGAIRNLERFDKKAISSGSKIKSKFKGIGASITNSFSGLGGKLSLAIGGAGSIAFLKNATTLAIDFETAMSKVKVALGANQQQSRNLQNQARDVGKSTIFSASEVAKAQLVLAKNGKTYQEILGGMTEASLNLSGALGGDLASSADLVTDAMSQFSLSTSEAMKVTDRLSGAANKSKFSFNDLRLAYAQAGGQAGAVGVEFEDFNASIVAISSAFGSGSDAGTSFKTFLTRLVPEGKPAKELMDKLGLSFFDASGNMDDMATISGKLNGVFSKMSEEQRLLASKTLFGNDASRAALLLAKLSSKEFNVLKKSIAGVSAEDVSIGNLGNTQRSIKQLQSAWQEFQLALVDAGALEALTNGINKLRDIVSELPKHFTRIRDLIVTISNLNPFTEHLHTSRELKELDEKRFKKLNDELNSLPKEVGIKVNVDSQSADNFFKSLKKGLQSDINRLTSNPIDLPQTPKIKIDSPLLRGSVPNQSSLSPTIIDRLPPSLNQPIDNSRVSNRNLEITQNINIQSRESRDMASDIASHSVRALSVAV